MIYPSLGLTSQRRWSVEASTGIDCKVADQEKNPLLKKRHLQARLKFEGQLGEKKTIHTRNVSFGQMKQK